MRIIATQFLLCFVMLFQSMAGAVVPIHHCPMQASGKPMAMDATAAYDCCNDAETYAKTGKPCKSGQECHVTNVCVFTLPPSVSPIPAPSPLQPAQQPDRLSSGVSSVWRPPISV
jgi:hypothetical protein